MSAVLSAAMRPAICELRMGKPEDLAFVVNVWADRLRRENKRLRTSEATQHVRALLSRDASRLIVAHVPEYVDDILGWAAVESGSPTCVHYIYVRKDARRLGIATAMVGARDVALDYSHHPPARWPPEGGRIGVPVVVPVTWSLNLKRGDTR